MPKKKNEEIEQPSADETVETGTEQEVVEASAADAPEVAAAADEAQAAPETDSEAVSAAADETVAAAEAPAEEAAAPAPKKKAAKTAEKAPKAAGTDTAAGESTDKKVHKRAERVGIVSSDKMTKTVTVRVDRVVKHPLYHKYVKRRKKFMAHDELGAKTGDKVRIVETRPLSARKRWRVVEIIQKAEL